LLRKIEENRIPDDITAQRSKHVQAMSKKYNTGAHAVAQKKYKGCS